MSSSLRRKLFAPVLAGCIALLPAAATAREFTDPYGRTIDAEIIAVTGAQVTLKLNNNGKDFTIPITKLSEKDQEFIKQWAKDNPHAIAMRFRLLADPVLGGKVVGEAEAVNKPGAVSYRLTIYNQSGADTHKLTVRYRIFVSDLVYKSKYSSYYSKRGTPELMMVEGKKEIETLPDAKRAEFITDPYRVDTYRYYGKQTTDQLRGIIVRIYAGDKVVTEQRFGTRDSMDDIGWDAVSPKGGGGGGEDKIIIR